jgi:hypothetical protein
VLWDAKQEDGNKSRDLSVVPQDMCELYLYDGPAETGPNPEWFSMTSKNKYHKSLYMPTWDLLEIKTANIFLELGLSEEQLLKRFTLFGKTVRYTLSTNVDFVELGRNAIDAALKQIHTINDVQRCFEGTLGYCSMHYIVNDDDSLAKANLKPGSIAVLMKDRLDKNYEYRRRSLMNWLDGSSKASVFSGWLFENFAHDVLMKGGSLQMRSLNANTNGDKVLQISKSSGTDNATAGLENSKTTGLEIPKTDGIYKRFKLEVDLADIFLEAYQMPESLTLPSLDSYMLTSGALYIFQMRRSMHHDVDVEVF